MRSRRGLSWAFGVRSAAQEKRSEDVQRYRLDEAARLTPSAGLYMVVQRGEAELMLRTSCAMDLQVWWDAIAEALRGTAVHPHRPGDVVVGAPIATAEPVVVAGLPA